MTLRTWHVETLVVGALLATSALAAGARALDWLSAGAVLLSFGHASIADRLAEREASRVVRSVHCVRYLQAYWVAKEALWVAVFAVGHVWPALVGCGVFLAHPVWRRWYRARKPLKSVA